MNALLDYILHLIYPPKCMFCMELLRDEDAYFCSDCFSKLPDYEGADRVVPGIDRAVATFSYGGTLRQAILRFKFRGMKCYGTQFAKWMADTVRHKLKEPYDLISWVPCSTRRKWTRGYDQAEVLALVLAKELGVETCRVLKKTRHNMAQSKIKKDEARRRANVSGVYKTVSPERWAGKRILLVDDVLTTGATLSECAKTLRLDGAKAIDCVVIAAAGKEKENDK